MRFQIPFLSDLEQKVGQESVGLGVGESVALGLAHEAQEVGEEGEGLGQHRRVRVQEPQRAPLDQQVRAPQRRLRARRQGGREGVQGLETNSILLCFKEFGIHTAAENPTIRRSRQRSSLESM